MDWNDLITAYYEASEKNDCDCKNSLKVIKEVYDGSYGMISYLEYHSKDRDEVFVGSYPYNGAELCLCENCSKLYFRYIETGGHLPQVLLIAVDSTKNYLNDPQAKAVVLNKKDITKFISELACPELLTPQNIELFNTATYQHLIDKNKRMLFDYQDRGDTISFIAVGEKEWLKAIYEFEQKNKELSFE
ncbi:MAG: hypothetical protein LBI72_05185 [Flavobacteriaceae bacterium]|nr:hypothetical protein [Flavobacteriaceae bacterium]